MNFCRWEEVGEFVMIFVFGCFFNMIVFNIVIKLFWLMIVLEVLIIVEWFIFVLKMILRFVLFVKIVCLIFFIVFLLLGLGMWLGNWLFGFKNWDFVVLVFKLFNIFLVKNFLVLFLVFMMIF